MGRQSSQKNAAGNMKTRRHHNNKGARQIKRGKTRLQVRAIAKRLGIIYGRRK